LGASLYDADEAAQDFESAVDDAMVDIAADTDQEL